MFLPVFLGVCTITLLIDLYRSASAKGPDAAEIVLPLFVFSIVLAVLLMLTYGLLLVRTSYVDFRNTLDDEKSVFVRMAADALRTPLTGMRWITEILLDDDLGSMNDNQRQSIKKMSIAIERLIRLVNELLKIMKLSGGLINYIPRPVKAQDIVHGAIETIEALIDTKMQTLIVKVDDAVQVEADAPLIQHVLQVLLSYASHLAPHKSAIQVVLRTNDRNVFFDIVFQGGDIQLHSMDQDIGDGKAVPWEEEHAPNLAISREILQAAKGSMHISSNGDEHTFSITIPRVFTNVDSH